MILCRIKQYLLELLGIERHKDLTITKDLSPEELERDLKRYTTCSFEYELGKLTQEEIRELYYKHRDYEGGRIYISYILDLANVPTDILDDIEKRFPFERTSLVISPSCEKDRARKYVNDSKRLTREYARFRVNAFLYNGLGWFLKHLRKLREESEAKQPSDELLLAHERFIFAVDPAEPDDDAAFGGLCLAATCRILFPESRFWEHIDYSICRYERRLDLTMTLMDLIEDQMWSWRPALTALPDLVELLWAAHRDGMEMKREEESPVERQV